jgi:hypothetical protein
MKPHNERRLYMKPKTTAKKFLVFFAVAVFAVSFVSVGSLSAHEKKSAGEYNPTWEWTGYNSMIQDYYFDPGYPSYDNHPRWLGELSGSWYQIGEQYGQRAGDFIRYVFEGWYRQHIGKYPNTQAMLNYLHQIEAYYEDLCPEALQMMKGMAAGAKKELDKSMYADLMTNYEKILMVNSYFQVGTPPAGIGPGAGEEEDVHNCSGAVILGAGTKDGKAIHLSSEDQTFFPQEYLVAYIANPSDKKAHRYTMTDSAGEIGSQTAMNEKGVIVSGYAGGGVDVIVRPGLDWQVGVWFATAFAGDAEEAVELLTVGTKRYRAKSGKKIVIGRCGRGVNWVVSDRKQAYVVESIPGDLNGVARYAVRVPGDLGEIGDYVVSTNTVEANYSYNENNEYDPTHPMSQHGNARQTTTSPFGLTSSGMRHTTLMTLIRDNYGNITLDMVQEWRRGHYFYDLDGIRHDTVWVEGYGEVPSHLAPGVATICRHRYSSPGVDAFTGINIYVSIGMSKDLTIYRTKGRPCEWVGPWDAIRLQKKAGDHDWNY